MIHWIISVDSEIYDHQASFKKNGYIDWRKTVNYKIGDIVYIYVTQPTGKVEYKTKVEKINLNPDEIIDDKEFWKVESHITDSRTYVRLKLIEMTDSDYLSLNYLLDNGLNAAPQRATKLTGARADLINYLEKYFSPSEEEYQWIPFYEEFADKLYEYIDRKDELFEIIKELRVKHSFFNYLNFENEEWWGPRNYIIDPFSVMAVMNRGTTDENRIKIANIYAEKFGINTPVPERFNGIPFLNNMHSFYGDTEENYLWMLFKKALEYAKTKKVTDDLIKTFDQVREDSKVGLPMITIALYWIRPHTFMPLDSLSRDYLPKTFDITVPSINEGGDAYFSFLKDLEQISEGKAFYKLSYDAWEYAIEERETNEDTLGEGLPDTEVKVPHYWIYSPGPGSKKWQEFYNEGIMAIGWSEFGDLSQYNTRTEMTKHIQTINESSSSFKNTTLAAWEFTHKMKIGDVIFVKQGKDKIIGWGIVKSDYYYNSKTEDEYKNHRKVDWKSKGEWEHPGKAVLKTLTDITSYTNYVNKLNNLVRDDIAVDPEDYEDYIKPEIIYDYYTREDFLNEVFMDKSEYENLVRLLKNKKNIILQGPPGVGKTFMAKRLAYSIIGEKNIEQVKMVQFHQSYSYEDFIEGFRPAQDGQGFEIKKGAFHDFCREAEKDFENNYFFVIDEINRGNLSKIFGELLMLIENDKRGHQLQLLYSDDKFSVPKNVHIIGMMNTADRSLAILDYALRRRFAFYDLGPAFQSIGFKSYQQSLNDSKFTSLVQTVEILNETIINDESLGRGFAIGHSYLSNIREVNDYELENIIEYEIIPLIREYWFDELTKVKEWEQKLRSSIR